ncbi:hypothetical protein BJ166DRAFT_158487 [Pestalotiopsis sp. NC0098]|nr:hypothetical protein BJ166DRAFT_158487 [Pestalotiopsis sp. NC0098]
MARRRSHSRPSARLESKERSDSENSSGDDSDIPARSPRKPPPSTGPTLSNRPLNGKRREGSERLSLAGSHKRQKISSAAGTPGWLRGPGSSRLSGTGSYPASETSRAGQFQNANDTPSRDAQSLQADDDDDENDVVDPRALAAANSQFAVHASAAGTGSQDHTEALRQPENNIEVPDIDLGHDGQEEHAIAHNGSELGDTDLGIDAGWQEPVEQENQRPQIQSQPDDLGVSNDHIEAAIDGDIARTAEQQSSQETGSIRPPARHEIADTVPSNSSTHGQPVEIRPARKSKLPAAFIRWGSEPSSLQQPARHDTNASMNASLPPQSGSKPFQGHNNQNKANDTVSQKPQTNRRVELSSGTYLPASAPSRINNSSNRHENAINRTQTSRQSESRHLESNTMMLDNEEGIVSSPRLGAERSAVSSLKERARPVRTPFIEDDIDDDPVLDEDSLFVPADQEVPSIDGDAEPMSYLDEEDFDPNRRSSQFRHDVRRFRENEVEELDDSAFFDAPSTGPLATIEIPVLSFAQTRSLMGTPGWSAIPNDWEKLLVEKRVSETREAKHMASYLAKLGRILSEAPSAADLCAQNKFLKEHSAMMKRYFSRIDDDVNKIRTRCLSSEHGTRDVHYDIDARQEMVKDLVRLVIPLLVALLGRGWALGQKLKGSSFTDFTVQILARLLGWIERLYRPLMRRLKTRPLPPDTKSECLAREALEPILVTLREDLNDAPNRLRQVEAKQIRAINERQHSLQMQERIKLQRQAQAEETKLSLREHNRKVALALRSNFLQPGHTRVGSAPNGSHSSDARVVPNPRQAREAGEAEPPPFDLVPWRREADISLCNHLKSAFDCDPPQLPKLSSLVYTLGHSGNEIRNRSAPLLACMIGDAFPDMTVSQKSDIIVDLLRKWR